MRGKKSRVLSYGICVHCVAQIDLKVVGDMEGRKEEWGVQNGGEWKQRAFHPIRVASGGIEISQFGFAQRRAIWKLIYFEQIPLWKASCKENGNPSREARHSSFGCRSP